MLHAAKLAKKHSGQGDTLKIFHAAVMLQRAAVRHRDLADRRREAGNGPDASALCRYGLRNINQHRSTLHLFIGPAATVTNNGTKVNNLGMLGGRRERMLGDLGDEFKSPRHAIRVPASGRL